MHNQVINKRIAGNTTVGKVIGRLVPNSDRDTGMMIAHNVAKIRASRGPHCSCMHNAQAPDHSTGSVLKESSECYQRSHLEVQMGRKIFASDNLDP